MYAIGFVAPGGELYRTSETFVDQLQAEAARRRVCSAVPSVTMIVIDLRERPDARVLSRSPAAAAARTR